MPTLPATLRSLLTRCTAVLALLLLVGMAMMMHQAAHEQGALDAPTSTSAVSLLGAAEGAASAGQTTGGETHAVQRQGAADCGDLCDLICVLMGLACAVTAMIGWALLRRPRASLLHRITRPLVHTLRAARSIAPVAPDLLQLQISRV